MTDNINCFPNIKFFHGNYQNNSNFNSFNNNSSKVSQIQHLKNSISQFDNQNNSINKSKNKNKNNISEDYKKDIDIEEDEGNKYENEISVKYLIEDTESILTFLKKECNSSIKPNLTKILDQIQEEMNLDMNQEDESIDSASENSDNLDEEQKQNIKMKIINFGINEISQENKETNNLSVDENYINEGLKNSPSKGNQNKNSKLIDVKIKYQNNLSNSKIIRGNKSAFRNTSKVKVVGIRHLGKKSIYSLNESEDHADMLKDKQINTKLQANTTDKFLISGSNIQFRNSVNKIGDNKLLKTPFSNDKIKRIRLINRHPQSKLKLEDNNLKTNYGKINDEINKTEDLQSGSFFGNENKGNCIKKGESNLRNLNGKNFLQNNKFCDKVIKFTQLDLPQKYSTIYGNFIKGFNLINPQKMSEITSHEIKNHKLKLFIHECGNLSKPGKNISSIKPNGQGFINQFLSNWNPFEKDQMKYISQNSNKQSEYINKKTRINGDNLIKQKTTSNCQRRFSSKDYTSYQSHHKDIYFPTNHKKNVSDLTGDSKQYFNYYNNEKLAKNDFGQNIKVPYDDNSNKCNNSNYQF